MTKSFAAFPSENEETSGFAGIKGNLGGTPSDLLLLMSLFNGQMTMIELKAIIS
jgi:hypothetical protein